MRLLQAGVAGSPGDTSSSLDWYPGLPPPSSLAGYDTFRPRAFSAASSSAALRR